ncbi:MAG TPA: helix-turn-helix domain-containing protein [Solirubrobacterales bacterium]
MFGNKKGGGENPGKRRRPSVVHKALTHPIRLDILLRLHEGGPLSPAKYCEGEQVKLSVAAYHFKVLLQHEAIVPAETIAQGSGVAEYLYSIDRDSLIGGFLTSPGASSECPGDEERPNASN